MKGKLLYYQLEARIAGKWKAFEEHTYEVPMGQFRALYNTVKPGLGQRIVRIKHQGGSWHPVYRYTTNAGLKKWTPN